MTLKRGVNRVFGAASGCGSGEFWMALQDIETIVIVIMENRSFDQMLGYLSLDTTTNRLSLEGLKTDPVWRGKFANRLAGQSFPIYRLGPENQTCTDPQHDKASIALQIDTPAAGAGVAQMGGFVESYIRFSKPTPTNPSAVMGYFDQATVPTFDFFARHYCVCDHWFSSLPLGTQANRLMAMAGESHVLDNAPLLLPEQPLVYDWLAQRKVSWCAYQSGDFLPFFSLMGSWLPEIATSLTLSQIGGRGRFRRYDRFNDEWQSDATMPSVIFIEPEYTDGPHVSPNDDHSPTGIAPGQAFLSEVYHTLISNPSRWAKTMLVITYDEHGGFFDHVPPLKIPTTVAGAPIATTGVRVPAFIVSPYVREGDVFTGPLDHTSILQLLDDRFGGGPGYSVAVNQRQASFDRILNALTPTPRSSTIPMMAQPPHLALRAALPAKPSAPNTSNAQALHMAAQKLAAEHADLLAQPGWEDLNTYLNTSSP